MPAAPSPFGPAVISGTCPITHAAYADCKVPGSVLNTSTTKPTWTLSAAYNPSPDTMIYGSYSRGYRQGATAPQAVGGKTSFLPEKVDSFELGVKTSWSGTAPGYFNITGFYSNIKDAQVLVGLSCTRTPAEYITSKIARSRQPPFAPGTGTASNRDISAPVKNFGSLRARFGLRSGLAGLVRTQPSRWPKL